jgi:hypothetical protein
MPDARLRMTPSPSSSRNTTSSLGVSDVASDTSATDGSVTRRACVSLWACAAAVRLLYLAARRPEFTIYYWQAASALRTDGSLSIEGVPTTALEPVYPLFLALSRSLVGDRPLVVQGIQALVAAFGAVYLCRLTLALTGRRQPAIASALLFAVYPMLVRHAVDGTESALVTLFLIAFAYHFVTVRRTRDAAAAGAWLGVAILTRSVALPLLAIAPLLLTARRGGRAAAAMTGVSLLVLAPFAIRNLALNGAALPTRSGLNLFLSNNEYSAGVIPGYGPYILLPYAQSRLAAEGLADRPPTPANEQQEDAAYRRMAASDMKARPGETVRLKAANVVRFFSPLLVPRFTITKETTIALGASGQSIVTNAGSRPLIDRIAYSVSYGLVLALAAAGVWMRHRDLRADGILWSVLLTFAAVHALFFPSTRYRTPVDFVFLFYAGIATAAITVKFCALVRPRTPAS